MSHPVAPTRIVLLAAGTTTGTGVAIDCSQFSSYSIWTQSAGTTSSGSVIFEEIDDPTFTGTWTEITHQDATGITGTTSKSYHCPTGNACLGWMRARVTSDIGGGGSISVVLRAI